MQYTCLAFITLSICTDVETIISRSYSPPKAQSFSPLLVTIFFSSYLSVVAQRCFFFLLFFFKLTRYGTSRGSSVLFSRKSLQRAPAINANRGHFVTRLYTSCFGHIRVSRACGAWVWVADGADGGPGKSIPSKPPLVLFSVTVLGKESSQCMFVNFDSLECLSNASWKSYENWEIGKVFFYADAR